MAFSNITLAMDLSIAQPGFAIVAITDEGLPIILDKSFVKTKAKGSHGYRLKEIETEIYRLIKEYEPEHIVREKGFSRFPKVTQTLFKVVGISDLAVHNELGKTVDEIAVTSVKKIVTGDGKAAKGEVERMARKWMQIEDESYFANDDEADAAAVGIAYLVQKGYLK